MNQQRITPNFEKRPTLYMVGYSHLDAQWCWTYPLVIDEMLRNTLYENFKCLNASSSYIINFPSANRYRSFKEFYPEEYQQVKNYVKEGRWFPAGSSLEECDVLAPSPESIIRNILYGNLFFEEELSVTSEEFMLPDCFGFPATLPSLLAHCGLKGFSTQKLSWRSARGIPFNFGWWEGPDGQGILAALNGGSYLTTITNDWSTDEKLLNRLKENGEKSDGIMADFLYIGTGDQGGAAGVESAEWMDKLSNNSTSPIQFISAQADWIFKDTTELQKQKLQQKKYQGDLLLIEHSAGSLSSQSYIKHWFRQSESLILNTEPIAVFAQFSNQQTYPKKQLREAWYLTSLLMFHDVLPGTSLPKAYEYSHNDALVNLALTKNILTDSAQAVSNLFNQTTTTDTVSLLIYNGLGFSRQEIIKAKLKGLPNNTLSLSAVDGATQKVIPIQILSRENDGLLVLLNVKMPSMGLKVIYIHAEQKISTTSKSELKITDNSLENSFYKVIVNKAGDIASIWDKKLQKELLAQPKRMAFMHDEPTNYPSWNMDWKDRKFPPKGYLEGEAKISITEQGPVRIALKIEREGENSRFAQTIYLYQGEGAGERVEFADLIDWRAKTTTLKAAFPLTASNPLATYSWECSTIQRDNNRIEEFEVPSHQWIDLTNHDEQFGISILTNFKYGSDKPSDNELRLTLLYTPGISRNLHHQHQETQDWGRHEIIYGLTSHAGKLNPTEVDAKAQSFNQPLFAFEMSGNQQGCLKNEFSFLQINPPAVKVMALKQCERSQEFLLRLNNISQKSISQVEISFGNGITSAHLVNGQEQIISENLPIINDKIYLDFTHNEIKSLIFIPKTFAQNNKSENALTQIELPFNAKITSLKQEQFSDGFKIKLNKQLRLPEELFPKTISIESETLTLAPANQNNVLRCNGQKIAFPAGKRRLIALVSSTSQDRQGAFKIGNLTQIRSIPSGTGYFGQWDTRLWDRHEPKITWEWGPIYQGLNPGKIKDGQPIWFCQHCHNQQGNNETYHYAYIYKIELDIPENQTLLTLPEDDNIILFALGASSKNKVEITSSIIDFPKYDDEFLYHVQIITEQKLNDCCQISLLPPWYHQAEPLEISLNHGPFVKYSSAFMIYQDTFIQARCGKSTHISERQIKVNDITPPSILSSRHCFSQNELEISFSEPINTDIVCQPQNIVINNNTVVNWQLSPCGKILRLVCDCPCSDITSLTFQQLSDCAPIKNIAKQIQVIIQPPKIIEFNQIFNCSEQGYDFELPNSLPQNPSEAWTLNAFIMPQEPLADNTLIVGFGSLSDQDEKDWGSSRFIGKTYTGICFWFNKMDSGTWVDYDLKKWQMITITWDGLKYRIFKNGIQIGEGTGRISHLTQNKISIAPRSTWETDPEKEKPFTGQVGNIMIINQALNQAEILKLIELVPEQRIDYKTMHMMI